MEADKTTLIDTQADVEGTLTGQGRPDPGPLQGRGHLTGRLHIGESSRVEAKVHGRLGRDRRGVQGRGQGQQPHPDREGPGPGQRRRPDPRGARRRPAERGGQLRGPAKPKPAAGPRPAPWPVSMLLRDVAERLGCELRGDGSVRVERVAAIEEAGPGDLTFVANPQVRLPPGRDPRHRRDRLAGGRDAAAEPALDEPLPRLRPRRGAAPPRSAARSRASTRRPQVDPSAVLGEDVHVGALVVIGRRVAGRRPHACCTPTSRSTRTSTIGDDCVLHSGVQVREGCRLGDRVIVQNGAVIGSRRLRLRQGRAGRYHEDPAARHRGDRGRRGDRRAHRDRPRRARARRGSAAAASSTTWCRSATR